MTLFTPYNSKKHRKNEKERWVPFSISPFKKKASDVVAPEKPNPWLELVRRDFRTGLYLVLTPALPGWRPCLDSDIFFLDL